MFIYLSESQSAGQNSSIQFNEWQPQSILSHQTLASQVVSVNRGFELTDDT